MKDGDENKLHGNFSMGLISSKLNLEGPIVKGKTTFNFSARRTYADLLARPFISKKEGTKEIGGYYFDDLNLKITHKFSDRSRIYLSAYSGKDEAYYRLDSKQKPVEELLQEKTKFSLGWGKYHHRFAMELPV